MSLKDTRTTFGWLSISVHWITAIVIVAMLLLGSSITGGQGDMALLAHTTLGLGSYAFLWWRIIWRIRKGHPGPSSRQSRWMHAVGRVVHYLMLLLVAGMLLSGPLTAWSGGIPIRFGGTLILPSPWQPDGARFAVFRLIHGSLATGLAVIVGLHIAGAIKHAIFDRDGTFDKMLTPHGAEASVMDRGTRSAPDPLEQ